jgi:protein involved in polysaccharide export with SLBB domain
MKKIILSALLINTLYINSQELDEAYLNSLPDDIKQDVLEQVDDRDELDKTIYRRPSTMVRKNYCRDVKKDRNEKIERDYYKKYDVNLDEECIEKSDRFGSNFFDMMQTSFMPINEPNFDGSYILDFGDILEVQIIGQKDSIDRLDIKRDGSINISDIGKIFISGLSLDAASNLIMSKINSTYIGVEAYISLVNIRDVQVLITGNAYNPGIYTLNGNSNILHALSMAGGMDDIGSYRQVDLIRNNEVINSIDLYNVFIHGKSGFGQRLRSGDSILIKPANNIVSISGAVKRPGTYELKLNESLLDLLNYANGFTDAADKRNIKVERLIDDNTQFIKIKNLNELASIKPNSGDRLDVRSYERKKVKIIGAVNSPGVYSISSGDTLYSLIIKADGYSDNAYPFGGILNNKKTLELNEQAVESLYTSFVQKLMTKGDPLFASESLPFALKELKKSDTSGRVMAEFDLSVLEANPDLDTFLDDGDEIIIPRITQQVYIFGEVNNNGAIRYMPAQTINDYISRSGGMTDAADAQFIYVVHPNGEVKRLTLKMISILRNRGNDVLIYPGSVIYVPRKVNGQEAAIVASIWAPIVSALASSLTALAVLDRN